MVGKLFKYEARFYLRWLIPIAAACLGLGIISKILYFVPDSPNDFSILFIITNMIRSVYLVAINAMIVFGYVIVGIRFLKSTFTQEAYFTHTIPVKSSTILNVKLLAGSLFVLALRIAAFGSILLIYTGRVTTTVIEAVSEVLSQASKSGNLPDVILISAEVAALAFFLLFVEILHPYAACALGQRMKSKVGGAIMFYFIIGGIIEAVMSFFYVGGISYLAFGDFRYTEPPLYIVHVALGIAVLTVAAFDVTFYLITRHRLKNRLNIT